MRHHHYTTSALALLFGLGVAATGTPAAAQQSVAGQPMAAEICDRNEDGFIDSQESWVCGDARFDEMSGGGDYITEGRHFINLYTEAEDPEGLFAEADADQDRQISREEWRAWQEQRFGAATGATGGRMAVADYERFERGEELAAAGTAGELGLEDVVAQLRESGDFSTFVRAIESAGLVEELKDAGPFTVFAPTDEAFNKLPQGALDQLMQGQDKSRIEDLVMHHLVLGEAHPADALPEQLDPLEGGPINVGIGDNGGAVLRPQGGQQVAVTREIAADNGYIQVIDAVLVPQQLAQTLQSGQQQQQQQAQQSGQQGQQAQQGQQQGQQQAQQQGQQAQQGQQQATAAGGQQQQAREQAVLTGGNITREQWTSVGADTFAQADADQSGFVTQQELERWSQTNWGGTPGGGDDDGPLFGLLDVNDDKQVTEDEWFTEESFGALDDDDSGVLEDDEFGV